MGKIQSKILLSIAAAAALYIGLIIWGQFDQLVAIFSHFNLLFLLPILVLVILSYLLRFCKWHYFLTRINLTVPWRQSLHIFLAGFAMAITPGKVGEIVKSYLLKQRYRAPLAQTVPVLFIDRLTDLIGYLIIAALSSVTFHEHGYTVLLVVGICTLGLIIILLWRSLCQSLISLLLHIPLLRSHVQKIERLYTSAYALLKPAYFLPGVLLSILAWTCECLGFFVVLTSLDQTLNAGSAIFVYAFSALVGALSMLPGGLGSTEATMAGLLNTVHITPSETAAIILLSRAVTLWFGIGIGLIALVTIQYAVIVPDSSQH